MSKRPRAQFDAEDEDNIEPFTLDQEFEEGEFGPDGEFYFKSQRQPTKRRVISKEEKIYADFFDPVTQ